MLVTRQCEIGRNTWSPSKLKAVYRDVAPPRMSNFEALATQPDWREQYSPFTLSGESGVLQPSFEQSNSADVGGHDRGQQQSATQSHLEPQQNFDAVQQDTQPSTLNEHLEVTSVGSDGQINNQIHDGSLVSAESRSLSLGSLANPASNAPQQTSMVANDEGAVSQLDLKDEDDDLDDDEMLDAEDGAIAPQTAAERRAERRKMKRFRYSFLTACLCALLLIIIQSHTSTDKISYERVRKASTSRRCTSRAAITGDPRPESQTGPGLVSKQVSGFELKLPGALLISILDVRKSSVSQRMTEIA